MTDPLMGIAHGAEQSRRVAWAKYFAVCEELKRWRDQDGGSITVTTCRHCGHRWYHELVPDPVAEFDGQLLAKRSLPLTHWNCWCNQ